MREKPPERLEEARIREGLYGSSRAYGMTGAFSLMGPSGMNLIVLASDGPARDEGFGWEHVSVSIKRRPPNWVEMCFVKDLFWEEEECVVHITRRAPFTSTLHRHCLHMWRPIGIALPAPPAILAGHPKHDALVQTQE